MAKSAKVRTIPHALFLLILLLLLSTTPITSSPSAPSSSSISTISTPTLSRTPTITPHLFALSQLNFTLLRSPSFSPPSHLFTSPILDPTLRSLLEIQNARSSVKTNKPLSVRPIIRMSASERPYPCLYNFEAPKNKIVIRPVPLTSNTHQTTTTTDDSLNDNVEYSDWITLSSLNYLRRTSPTKVNSMWHAKYDVLGSFFPRSKSVFEVLFPNIMSYVKKCVLNQDKDKADEENGIEDTLIENDVTFPLINHLPTNSFTTQILPTLLLDSPVLLHFSLLTTLYLLLQLLKPALIYLTIRLLTSHKLFWQHYQVIFPRLVYAPMPFKLWILQVGYRYVLKGYQEGIVERFREVLVGMENEGLEIGLSEVVRGEHGIEVSDYDCDEEDEDEDNDDYDGSDREAL